MVLVGFDENCHEIHDIDLHTPRMKPMSFGQGIFHVMTLLTFHFIAGMETLDWTKKSLVLLLSDKFRSTVN